MSTNRKVSGLLALALAFVFVAGAAVESFAGGAGCPSSKGKAGCATAGKGCTAAEMGSCTSAKGAQAATMGSCTSAKGAQAAAGCCAGKAKGAQASDVRLPDGTQVARVDVDGGMDLVFTGADLTGIEKFLNANLASCTESWKKGKESCGQTCSIAKNDKEKNVVLSIRGQEAETCCATWMQQASLTDEAKGAATEAKISKKS